MRKLYSTMSSKGQVVVPAAIRETLGIEAGTRVAFWTEGSRLILEPETLASKLKLIESLRGLTKGGPSMTDELLEDRRRERATELAKEGW
jgi:AbrB family looped-hinge helix DNA binding protein